MSLWSTDIYRARHSVILWTGIIFACIFVAIGTISYVMQLSGISTPSFVLTNGESSHIEAAADAPITQLIGYQTIAGNFLPLVCSLALVVFFFENISSGFYASVVSYGISRSAIIIECMAFCIVYITITFATCCAIAMVIFTCAGIPFHVHATATQTLIWFVLCILHIATYTCIACTIAILTQKRSIGIAATIIISSGILEMIIIGLAQPAITAKAASASSSAAILPALLPKQIALSLCVDPSALFSAYASLPIYVYTAAMISYGAILAVCVVCGIVLFKRKDITCME